MMTREERDAIRADIDNPYSPVWQSPGKTAIALLDALDEAETSRDEWRDIADFHHDCRVVLDVSRAAQAEVEAQKSIVQGLADNHNRREAHVRELEAQRDAMADVVKAARVLLGDSQGRGVCHENEPTAGCWPAKHLRRALDKLDKLDEISK